MAQYGFFFDESRCVDCRACSIACKDWNDIPPGPVKLLRMFTWETGAYPTTKLRFLFAPCYHCANAVCVDAAAGAMYKEEKYGAVLIDPQKANQPSMQAAAAACPYGAITFDSDAPDATAYKCNMCVDRLEGNRKPICVNACPLRALDFGTMDELASKYGTLGQLEGMPSPDATTPSVVFKAAKAKVKLVPYDETKAVQLMIARPAGLPNAFNSPADLSGVLPDDVGRGKLKMKASSTKEVLASTQNDES